MLFCFSLIKAMGCLDHDRSIYDGLFIINLDGDMNIHNTDAKRLMI